METTRRLGEQIPELVHRAALDPDWGPRGAQRLRQGRMAGDHGQRGHAHMAGDERRDHPDTTR